MRARKRKATRKPADINGAVKRFPTVKTEDDVRKFFRWLMEDIGMIFHPDDSFVDGDQGGDAMRPETAEHLDGLLKRSFCVCDPYKVGVKLIDEGIGPYQYLKAKA